MGALAHDGAHHAPPSIRDPYATKDPDKIIVQAVYFFMNQFAKTPASQLVSGVGSVTDRLILRLTTEGLFIDDVRGMPQCEWDVKAWTLRQVEVWCPPHCLSAAAASAAPSAAAGSSPQVRYMALRRDAARALTGDNADVFFADMLRACCALGLCASRFANTDIESPAGQTGAWKAKGLHVIRATIRDQEGKRYVFVLDEAESWKLAVGLQRHPGAPAGRGRHGAVRGLRHARGAGLGVDIRECAGMLSAHWHVGRVGGRVLACGWSLLLCRCCVLACGWSLALHVARSAAVYRHVDGVGCSGTESGELPPPWHSIPSIPSIPMIRMRSTTYARLPHTPKYNYGPP